MIIKISARNYSGFIGPYEFKNNECRTDDKIISERFKRQVRSFGWTFKLVDQKPKPKRRPRRKKAE